MGGFDNIIILIVDREVIKILINIMVIISTKAIINIMVIASIEAIINT